ncbi:MAG: flagellar basal-body MS-ring/collar protein FliF [Thermodesulfobacteriota bacterium]|nr:flagellar basal-body MS-ring/collar protein FliF [Thermodesulfobacteriota bacterium]
MGSTDFSTQLKVLYKSLTPGKRISILILVSVTLAGFILMMMWSGRPDFQLLYSNLTPDDAGAIIAKLKDQKIPFQISSNGRAILIPDDKVYESRLELAAQGLPQGSGVGFEIFDETKLGMTDFVQNVNYQRACQGELSRTINGINEVESSRVHIVMPTRSLFVEEDEPATASVVLKLHRGRTLNKDQIQGIVHLVSSSISGLNPEKVTIVDNYGKMLTNYKGESATGQISSDQLAFQEKMERGFENRVKTMLEKALGPDKAIVRVSCLLDFKRQEKTEEMFQPANRVVRSEQLLNESSKGANTVPAGVPGVVTNLSEQKEGSNATTQQPTFEKSDRTVNYEIGKVTSHTIEPTGTLKSMSVAVIVDGTYNLVKEKRKKATRQYIPRTDEEMSKFEQIVKTAVNFNADRGDEVEVVNIPIETSKLKLEQEDEVIPEEDWLTKLKSNGSIVRYAFVGAFLFFSFLFVVRPVVKWLTNGPAKEGEIPNQLPMTVSELEGEYLHGMGLPFRNRAMEMIANDKENSIALMRDWIKEK